MIQHEWKFQEQVATFLKHALPPTAYCTGIDHARKMSKAAGARRKARGIKAGIPDVHIAFDGITLWIELKAGTSLSDAQERTRDALRRNGHQWELAKSIDEVQQACAKHGIPLRAYVLPEARTAARTRTHSARKAEPRFQVGKRVTGRLRAQGVAI